MSQSQLQSQIVVLIILAPIWLPLWAIFVLIQFIQINQKIKQFQHNRLKQLLSPCDCNTFQSITQETKIKEQIIFELHLICYLDAKLLITKSRIQLVCEDGCVLYSQKVPCNFQSKYFNNFCYRIYDVHFMQADVAEKELILPKSEFSQPCVCYGKIFLNIYDLIFTIEDFQLNL
ncbi:Hypothetical_protein [Hexamita inflata]|uniref:Hypothetical_protein n=1 Tax=Hexamita inflata TaxID=28002 RepID=A0AA86PH85_9EUKA|nr:Hypothetical protein HINF_LOCUS25902 [Hexamita inflata]